LAASLAPALMSLITNLSLPFLKEIFCPQFQKGHWAQVNQSCRILTTQRTTQGPEKGQRGLQVVEMHQKAAG